MPADMQAADLLEGAAVPFLLVLTKADHVRAPEALAALQAETAERARQAGWRQWQPGVLAVSAHARTGLDTLRGAVVAAARTPPRALAR